MRKPSVADAFRQGQFRELLNVFQVRQSGVCNAGGEKVQFCKPRKALEMLQTGTGQRLQAIYV